MLDAETSALLQRLVLAVERIANHLAPVEAQRERRPATLTSARYTREERDRQEVKAVLRGEKPKPQG